MIHRKGEELEKLARSGSLEANKRGVKFTSYFDPGCSSRDMNPSIKSKGAGESSHKIEDHLGLLDAYLDGIVKWGGAKARSSKHLRSGEAVSSDARSGFRECLDDPNENKNNVGSCIMTEKARDTIPPCLEIETNTDNKMGEATTNTRYHEDDVSRVLDGFANGEVQSIFSDYKDHQESLKWVNVSVEDAPAAATHYQNGIDQPPELKECNTPVSMKLRITSKCLSMDSEISELKIKCSQENHIDYGCDSLHHSSSEVKENLISEAPKFDEANGIGSDHRGHRLQDLDAQVNESPVSTLNVAEQSHIQSKKMYNVVYRRSKSHRDKTNSEHGGSMGESTQNKRNLGMATAAEIHEDTADGDRRTRSSKLKSASALQSEEKCRSAPNGSLNGNQLPSEKWESNSRMTVGMRSTRNRSSNYSLRDTSPMKKSHQSDRKGSWLILTMHEEDFRYIPQQGDEIVYLRQGHEEYFSHTHLKDPWTTTLKGKVVRAVEFCKVEELKYSTFPGSGESCCKLILKFTDPNSNVFGKSFTLTLPELTSCPDFLVERTRYDAAISRNWSIWDKCKVWWKNEGGNDGSWWDGRVVSVKPKSFEFPDSPWERYAILYRDESRDALHHSPWELFDADTQWEQPQIDSKSRNKLLSELAKLRQSGRQAQDKYGVNKLKSPRNVVLQTGSQYRYPLIS
ncbi:hypothetical protein SLE2022_164910 [Rubroshorea leprosula]